MNEDLKCVYCDAPINTGGKVIESKLYCNTECLQEHKNKKMEEQN